MLAETLIDNAVKVCKSKSELARRIGVHPPEISDLLTGKRVLSPELAALIADVAGVDPRQAALDAVIERDLRRPDGGRIAEILGKVAAAGAAALLLFYCSAPLIGATGSEAVQLTLMHIVSSSMASLIAAFLVIGCATVRVPQARLSVKGKGFAAVLTRSLRFATGCGFRAAP